MGENVAWIVVFAVVVPVLFTVVKLAWDEQRRHENVCRKLSHLEDRIAEQHGMLEQMRARR